MKLTPLNFAASALLVGVFYQLSLGDSPGNAHTRSPLKLLWLLPLLVIADILFRRYLKDLKRIWIVELLFIIFAIILILIFKS